MLAKVFSAAVWGVDAYAVEVEANAAPSGKQVTVVVGLPDTAVKESCHRVITAVMNSAFRYPHGRVTFNLAPADVKKEGPSFDLPMALGIISASEQLSLRNVDQYWIVGELALTGEVGPVGN
jgi:magnesium chelatase family protein